MAALPPGSHPECHTDQAALCQHGNSITYLQNIKQLQTLLWPVEIFVLSQ